MLFRPACQPLPLGPTFRSGVAAGRAAGCCLRGCHQPQRELNTQPRLAMRSRCSWVGWWFMVYSCPARADPDWFSARASAGGGG